MTILMDAISLSAWMKVPADIEKSGGQVLGQLVLRGDGISEIVTASGPHRGLPHHVRAPHEHSFAGHDSPRWRPQGRPSHIVRTRCSSSCPS